MYPTLILTHYQCRAAAIEFLLHSPALWMEALPGTVRETHIIIIIIVCIIIIITGRPQHYFHNWK